MNTSQYRKKTCGIDGIRQGCSVRLCEYVTDRESEPTRKKNIERRRSIAE